MLKAFKRWLGGGAQEPAVEAAARWAAAAGYTFKRNREGLGFVVESGTPGRGWRLEWGAPQRHYIEGAELRLRAEVGRGTDAQLVLASRRLVATLERLLFEQATEDARTRIGGDTPEEMRWLALHTRATSAQLRALRGDFDGVSSLPALWDGWLGGAFAAALDEARRSWLAPDDALIFTLNRGRLTLRSRLLEPEPERCARLVALFEKALAALRDALAQLGAPTLNSSVQPSSWSQLDEGPGTRG